MKLPQLKELLEKTRFEKETGEKLETSFEEYQRIFKQFYDKNESEFLFGQYSDIHKLGMNPKSKFNTPMAIYSYPLAYISPNDIQDGAVPFAGDRKYIVMFTVKPQYRNNILIIDEHGEASADSPIKEEYIQKKLEEHIKDGPDGFDLDGTFRSENKEVIDALKSWVLPNLQKVLSPNMWSSMRMRNLIKRIDGFMKGTVKLSKRPEMGKKLPEDVITVGQLATFFNSIWNNIEDQKSDFADRIQDLETVVDEFNDKYNKHIQGHHDLDWAADQARFKTFVGMYWNVTRVKASDMKKWAQLMVKDGIYGVIDEGSGMVHPSEPTQAIMFSKQYIELVSIIDNPALQKNSRVDTSDYDPYDLKNIKKIVSLIPTQFRHAMKVAYTKAKDGKVSVDSDRVQRIKDMLADPGFEDVRKQLTKFEIRTLNKILGYVDLPLVFANSKLMK